MPLYCRMFFFFRNPGNPDFSLGTGGRTIIARARETTEMKTNIMTRTVVTGTMAA